MFGSDYCYIAFFDKGQYQEKWDCLVNQGSALTSNFCYDKFASDQDQDAFETCLQDDYGIPKSDSFCGQSNDCQGFCAYLEKADDRYNCFKKFGQAGDARMCLLKESVTDDSHYYSLKYKYQCLASGNNGDF